MISNLKLVKRHPFHPSYQMHVLEEVEFGTERLFLLEKGTEQVEGEIIGFFQKRKNPNSAQ